MYPAERILQHTRSPHGFVCIPVSDDCPDGYGEPYLPEAPFGTCGGPNPASVINPATGAGRKRAVQWAGNPHIGADFFNDDVIPGMAQYWVGFKPGEDTPWCVLSVDPPTGAIYSAGKQIDSRPWVVLAVRRSHESGDWLYTIEGDAPEEDDFLRVYRRPWHTPGEGWQLLATWEIENGITYAPWPPRANASGTEAVFVAGDQEIPSLGVSPIVDYAAVSITLGDVPALTLLATWDGDGDNTFVDLEGEDAGGAPLGSLHEQVSTRWSLERYTMGADYAGDDLHLAHRDCLTNYTEWHYYWAHDDNVWRGYSAWLTAPAAAGDTRISIETPGLIGAFIHVGDTLNIGDRTKTSVLPSSASVVESVVVAGFEGEIDKTSHAVILLDTPLQHDHEYETVIANLPAAAADAEQTGIASYRRLDGATVSLFDNGVKKDEWTITSGHEADYYSKAIVCDVINGVFVGAGLNTGDGLWVRHGWTKTTLIDSESPSSDDYGATAQGARIGDRWVAWVVPDRAGADTPYIEFGNLPQPLDVATGINGLAGKRPSMLGVF